MTISKHKPTVAQLHKMIADLTYRVKAQEETIKAQKDELMFWYDDSFNGRNDYRLEGYEQAEDHYQKILTLIKWVNDNKPNDLITYILEKEMPQDGTYSDEFVENPFREDYEDVDICPDGNPFCENGSCLVCRQKAEEEELEAELAETEQTYMDNPFA